MSFEERGKKEHCECTLRQRITKNSYIQVDRGFYHSNYCLRSLYCGKLQKSLTMAFVLQWVTSSVKIVWKFSQMQLPCLERWNGVLLCKKEQCLICSYQLLGQLSRKPTLLFECFEKALRGNEIFFMDDPPYLLINNSRMRNSLWEDCQSQRIHTFYIEVEGLHVLEKSHHVLEKPHHVNVNRKFARQERDWLI